MNEPLTLEADAPTNDDLQPGKNGPSSPTRSPASATYTFADPQLELDFEDLRDEDDDDGLDERSCA